MEQRKPLKVFEDDSLYPPKVVAQKLNWHVQTVHKKAKAIGLTKYRPGPNTTRFLGSELNERLFPAD
jgi:hypothetical protein